LRSDGDYGTCGIADFGGHASTGIGVDDAQFHIGLSAFFEVER
jgi:hypothetical protein